MIKALWQSFECIKVYSKCSQIWKLPSAEDFNVQSFQTSKCSTVDPLKTKAVKWNAFYDMSAFSGKSIQSILCVKWSYEQKFLKRY